MKKGLIFIFLLCGFLVGCQEQNQETETPYENDDFLLVNNVEEYTRNAYYLDVELDSINHKLLVSGDIIYVNDKTDFDELFILMYANARNDLGIGDNVVFTKFKINDIDYEVEYSGEDNTSIHVDLDETLHINENAIISFEYEFNYWTRDRIVYMDNYYQTMFFYPYVAVYDEDGWNHDPYTYRGESYYNEMGDYYVSIKAPSDYEVATSGKKIGVINDGDDKIHHLQLENGRDFSFSASSLYYVYKQKINGIDFEIYSIRMLSTTEKTNSFKILEDSFRIFQDYIGDYYYDHFILEYGHIYGMESTGIIYCSEHIDGGTVVHEVIHQWFYSIIGNDQSDYSFIDESLTTFSAGIYYNELYGREGAQSFFDYRDSLSISKESYYDLYQGVDMLQKVDGYSEGYGYIIYYHGPTLFRYYLDEFLDGDFNRLKIFMNAYYAMYNGEEVTLGAFLSLLETSTGEQGTVDWWMGMLQGLSNPYDE